MAGRDKRRHILLAAEKLFTNRRFHEITLDEVAREAGVGKGTIYLHFNDKTDLFFQVATSGFEELCGLLRQAVGEKKGFKGQLRDACIQISTFFERRHRLFRMMQVEEARMAADRGVMHERWMAKRHELRAAVAEIFRRGVAEGAVRHDIPAEALASFLLGMLHARAHDVSDVSESATSYEALVDLFCHGATPRRAARRGLSRRRES